MLLITQSGLVVSGNNSITVSVVATSGDALMSQSVSGKTYGIFIKKARSATNPLLGGTFTEIADYIDCEIFHHGVYANVSGSQVAVRQMVNDFKITVASGSFSNPPRPYLASEDWGYPHEKTSKATLQYRFKYVQ